MNMILSRLTQQQIVQQRFEAGADSGISNLDLLTFEQTLIAADDAVAISDAALVQGQIEVLRRSAVVEIGKFMAGKGSFTK
jgi:hypothetical protein